MSRLWYRIRWALFALCMSCALNVSAATIHTLTQGYFTFSDTDTPPASDRFREPVQLPDNWTISHPNRGGMGWYHFTLMLHQQPLGLWAVYLPRLSVNAEVYLNDTLIGSGGNIHNPEIFNTLRPLLFHFPAQLLHQGNNRIDVRILGYANENSGLNTLKLGPDKDLDPPYREQFFREVQAPMISFGLLILLSAWLFLIWWRHRQEKQYLMFALCGFFSLFYTSAFMVRDHSPLSHPLWMWIIYCSASWYVYSVALLIHRFVNVSRPRFETWLFIYTATGTLLVAATPAAYHFSILGIMDLGMAAVSIYVIYLIYRYRQTCLRSEWILLFCALSFSAATGYHDVFINLAFPEKEIGSYYFYWGSTVVGIAIALLLLLRFDRSLSLAESMNRELYSLVDKKSLELNRSFQERQELETRHAVLSERERIMRELHDGLGGYLVSALVQAERAPSPMPLMQQTLRAALNDLRIMIDSLDSDPSDIVMQLGPLRERLESCMEANGTILHWSITDQPKLPHANSTSALHMSRIIQEIFTNIAKHSSARNAYFTVDNHRIEIRDDGRGFDVSTAKPGRGLPNLRQRADQIGIRLDITSSTKGTQIFLSW